MVSFLLKLRLSSGELAVGLDESLCRIAALMNSDDIGLQAHARWRTEIDACGFEARSNRFEGFPSRCRGAAFDGLDGRDGHAGGTGEIGLAPFEQGTGGADLSIVYHGLRIVFWGGTTQLQMTAEILSCAPIAGGSGLLGGHIERMPDLASTLAAADRCSLAEARSFNSSRKASV